MFTFTTPAMASLATSGQAMSLKALHSPGNEALNGSRLHFPDKSPLPEISTKRRGRGYAAGLNTRAVWIGFKQENHGTH